jgi:drug/metabolite transporter (DMT)-like permease
VGDNRPVAASALLLFVTIFFWGTAFRATAIAAEDASPIIVTALRAGPAALILVLAAVALRRRLPGKGLWLCTVITGLLTVTLTLEGITEGAARAGAGNAAVLFNASPFFVLILARIFMQERVTAVGLLGLVLGFGGIVLMVSSQLGDIANTGNFVLGMSLALAGAVGWAIGVLMVKIMFTRHPEVDMVGFSAGQYLVGGTAVVALAFALEGTGSAAWDSGDLWGAVAWISIGASAIATVTFFGALKRMSATTVTAWQFLVPVVAVLTEIVYGNTPGAVVLAGMGLAIGGVALVNSAPLLSQRVAERRLLWSTSARAR